MTPSAVAKSIGACELGQAWSDRFEDFSGLWESIPRAEFALFYLGKTASRDGLRNPAFRQFARETVQRFHALFSDRDIETIEGTIREAKPDNRASWACAAVWCVAKARELAEMRNPWRAARAVSLWASAASAMLAMFATMDEKEACWAVCAEEAQQAETLRKLLPDPFTTTGGVL